MDRCVRTSLLGLVCFIIIPISSTSSKVLAACPNNSAIARDATFTTPYAFVTDVKVVMVVDAQQTPSPLQDHIRNSTIATLTEAGDVVLGFESDATPNNGLYLVQYNGVGNPRCLSNTDFPLRMDDTSTPGLHRHISLAMRRINAGDHDEPFGDQGTNSLQAGSPRPFFALSA